MVFDKIDINGDGETRTVSLLTTAKPHIQAAMKNLNSACMFVFIIQVNYPMKSSWRGFRMMKCCWRRWLRVWTFHTLSKRFKERWGPAANVYWNMSFFYDCTKPVGSGLLNNQDAEMWIGVKHSKLVLASWGQVQDIYCPHILTFRCIFCCSATEWITAHGLSMSIQVP